MKALLPACLLTLLLLSCSAGRNKASAPAQPAVSQKSLAAPDITTAALPRAALDALVAPSLSAGESAVLLNGEVAPPLALVAAAASSAEASSAAAPSENAPTGVDAAAAAPEQEPPTTEPPWISDKAPSAMFWGVGSAKQSNTALSLTMAANRARVDIATQVYRFALRAGYTNLSQQTILAMRLEPSRVIQQWQAPDGTWWCLVEYSETDAQQALSKLNLGD